MKVAITSKGQTIDSEVDLRFGRAEWFILADTESGDHTAIENKQNAQAVQGAGIQAGMIIAENKAEVVITGNVGPKAFKVLQAAGIKVYLCDSILVSEAVDCFKKGTLKLVSNANVKGHWV